MGRVTSSITSVTSLVRARLVAGRDEPREFQRAGCVAASLNRARVDKQKLKQPLGDSFGQRVLAKGPAVGAGGGIADEDESVG
jgi:hypothetical protein